MITGHTKFSPDWCFSLWKKRYCQTKVSSLSDFVEVVNASAIVNFAGLKMAKCLCNHVFLKNLTS